MDFTFLDKVLVNMVGMQRDDMLNALESHDNQKLFTSVSSVAIIKEAVPRDEIRVVEYKDLLKEESDDEEQDRVNDDSMIKKLQEDVELKENVFQQFEKSDLTFEFEEDN